MLKAEAEERQQLQADARAKAEELKLKEEADKVCSCLTVMEDCDSLTITYLSYLVYIKQQIGFSREG